MKISIAALFAAFGTASAINTASDAGKKMLSSARRLDGQEEIDFGWVANFDIKYQGCHHIKQWNEEADGQDDVRIYTKRLVRFRLCPSGTCSSTSAGGCSSGYGEYIIDMDTFLESYVEARRQDLEQQCEHQINYVCDCEDDDGKDDGFDRDICEYDCLVAAGLDECVENNPYVDDAQQEEQQDMDRFLECQQLEMNNNNNNGNNNNGEQVVYYAGPYCSEQGGAIKVGVFTDDACTEFAQDITFYEITGYTINYLTESIVGEECFSCMEPKDEEQQYNANNGNDAQDADEVREQCEALYQGAGKCEYDISGPYQKNQAGCNYMEGIKIVRADGMLDVSDARPSAAATAFIVVFAMSFAAMGFYVWYLRTRLGVKQNSLL
uniref:Uncharacterized protein n=1 Tax=Amphora coffeiformis TaxID=265554 RepID=A0A7S3L1X9_9STRA